jgi:hypothetical protein
MMNSTADDFDFPPNPFRSPPASSGTQQQQPQQQQRDFFTAPPADPATQQQYHHDPLSHSNSINNNNNNSARGLPTNAGQARTSASLGGMMDDHNAPQEIPVAAAAPTSRLAACVSCTRMDTYRSYFDVDTIDIQARIKNSVLMCYMPDKFRVAVIGAERNDATKGPDLYGPLWITMTLVFLLAVSR